MSTAVKSPATKSPKAATVTSPEVATPATEVEVFQFNTGAARKSLSMVIYHLMSKFNPSEFFGVTFTPEMDDYLKKEAADRALRILGTNREPGDIKTPADILAKALELRPNAGGGLSTRSETATRRQEFLKELKTLNTVEAVEAHAASWPEMPGTVADTVSLRKSIAQRKADRATEKANREKLAAERPTRKKASAIAPAPAPEAVAAVKPTKRPVVATIA